jgi:ABC-type phosphate transport system substrate-binding protein
MARVVSSVIALGLAVLLLADIARETASSAEPPKPAESLTYQPLAIIANRSNTVNGLTMAELRKLFLGDRGHWPDGHRVTLVMREPGEPERQTILRDVCQMNENDFKNHFLHGLFTGEILVSPKILDTPTGVRKFIFNVPGAIGYLRQTDVDATVKVLRIDEALPEDPGYKLHVEVPPVY